MYFVLSRRFFPISPPPSTVVCSVVPSTVPCPIAHGQNSAYVDVILLQLKTAHLFNVLVYISLCNAPFLSTSTCQCVFDGTLEPISFIPVLLSDRPSLRIYKVLISRRTERWHYGQGILTSASSLIIRIYFEAVILVRNRICRPRGPLESRPRTLFTSRISESPNAHANN